MKKITLSPIHPLSKAVALLALLGFAQCTATTTDQAPETTVDSLTQGLPDPLAAGWEGASVCEVLVDNEHHRILRCTFAPGVGHERHYHPPHTGYTLAGGTFQISSASGTRTVTVPTGSTFGNEEVSIHEVLNVGETTAAFLIIEPKPQAAFESTTYGRPQAP